MAELPINEQYRITSDPMNWIVERGAASKGGGVRWRAITFHATLQDAVNCLGNRMVRESNANGVAEVLAQIENVRNTLLRALASRFDVEIKVYGESQS